jgi:uncharacterized protein
MDRYLPVDVHRDLLRKMVILTGPRQVGKTWLAKALMKEFKRPQYLNYDSLIDARIIRNQTWTMDADPLVLDEIHKMKDWKSFLKGTYDTRPEGQSVLVTGSARPDTFRQGGESLAGRYFPFRLDPVSVKEAKESSVCSSTSIISRIRREPTFRCAISVREMAERSISPCAARTA